MISVSIAKTHLENHAKGLAARKALQLSERSSSAVALRSRLKAPNRNWLVRLLLAEELAFIDDTARLLDAEADGAKAEYDAWDKLPEAVRVRHVWSDAVDSLRATAPEVIDTLEGYEQRLAALRAMAERLSTDRITVEPFLGGVIKATLLSDIKRDVNGDLYRLLYTEDRREFRYFVTPQTESLHEGPGTGVLSFNEFDQVSSTWKEASFVADLHEDAVLAPTDLEKNLNKRFATIIQHRATHLHTWQENLISADIVDVLEEFQSFSFNSNGLWYSVVLSVFKQQHRQEHLHGDLCVVVETKSDVESVLGAAYLEAKKLDLESKRFRTIEEEQLRRIKTHTNMARLLLYSPAPASSDWWASTIDMGDYLKALPLRRDARVSAAARNLGAQFVQRYFIGEDLDPGPAAVNGALAAAANCTRGVHVAIGIDHNEDLSQKLQLEIPPNVRHLMARAFGYRVNLDLDRELGRDHGRGLGRGRSRGHGLGGMEL